MTVLNIVTGAAGTDTVSLTVSVVVMDSVTVAVSVRVTAAPPTLFFSVRVTVSPGSVRVTVVGGVALGNGCGGSPVDG